MPFRVLLDNVVVAPTIVDDRQIVECPEYGGEMFPREGEEVARHFYHTNKQRAKTVLAPGNQMFISGVRHLP